MSGGPRVCGTMGKRGWRLLSGAGLAVVIAMGLAIPVLAASGAFSSPAEIANPDRADLNGDLATVASAQGSVTAFVTVADNVDSDGDEVLNAQDNCLLVANGPDQAGIPGVGDQTNTDKKLRADLWRLGVGSPLLPEDPQGDACDADDDNDGVSDADEQVIFGSPGFAPEQLVPCSSTLNSDPWAPDLFPTGTPDTVVNINDLVAILGFFGTVFGEGGYLARTDIFQPGAVININDLVAVLGFFGQSCAPPP